jgi:hypothetical protein
MRTTVDIDAPILQEVQAIHEQEGRSLDAVVSELLADALARRRIARERPPHVRWFSQPMHALVDLSDPDAVHAALDHNRS